MQQQTLSDRRSSATSCPPLKQLAGASDFRRRSKRHLLHIPPPRGTLSQALPSLSGAVSHGAGQNDSDRTCHGSNPASFWGTLQRHPRPSPPATIGRDTEAVWAYVEMARESLEARYASLASARASYPVMGPVELSKTAVMFWKTCGGLRTRPGLSLVGRHSRPVRYAGHDWVSFLDIGEGGIPRLGKSESTNSGATKPVPFFKNEGTHYAQLAKDAHDKQ